MATNKVSIKTFSQMLNDATKAGITNQHTKKALEWYQQYTREFAGTLASKMMVNEKANLTTRLQIGKMYAYFYDPKHKKTLPYYDRCPMIFLIDIDDDSFLGLNLHYLPPQLRVKLMDALFSLENDAKLDKNKKLVMTYQLLKSSTKFRWFKPCVKRYLKAHVKSRFLEIPYENWALASMLPVSQFEKKSVAQIWRDSREKI